MMRRSFLYGALGAFMLFGVYLLVLTLVSGWSFTREQFAEFWYYLLPLTAGFGIQVGLYSYLRRAASHMHTGGVLAVSGTTSTAAMVSCCAHYAANLLPILGTAGIVTFAAQYQVELFWVGILANLAGIAYIGSRIHKMKIAMA